MCCNKTSFASVKKTMTCTDPKYAEKSKRTEIQMYALE